MQGLDPKVHVCRIAHTVGEKKRVQILEEAKKINIRILNPGLKKAAEAVPEVPEVTPEQATPEPTPESSEAEKEAIKPPEPKPKAKKKAKPKTGKKGKSKK